MYLFCINERKERGVSQTASTKVEKLSVEKLSVEKLSVEKLSVEKLSKKLS